MVVVILTLQSPPGIKGLEVSYALESSEAALRVVKDRARRPSNVVAQVILTGVGYAEEAVRYGNPASVRELSGRLEKAELKGAGTSRRTTVSVRLLDGAELSLLSGPGEAIGCLWAIFCGPDVALKYLGDSPAPGERMPSIVPGGFFGGCRGFLVKTGGVSWEDPRETGARDRADFHEEEPLRAVADGWGRFPARYN